MSSTGEDIVRRIESALLRSAMSARQLSEASGIEESILSKVRSGSRNLKVSELSKIAEALGVSPLALLRDDSLVAKLPLAARNEDGRNSNDAYLRILALTELHEVLERGGQPARRLDERHTAVIPSHEGWLAAIVSLAQRARQEMPIEDGPDQFAALVNAIGNHLKIDVLIERFPDDSLIGAALTDHRFPFIFVNAEQSRQRALFTLAHELGHLLAGHTSDGVWDRARTFNGKTPDERIANAFAAEFLMPIDSIGQIIGEFGRTAAALGQMIIRFGISYESLIYRLHNGRLISADGRDALLRRGWAGLLPLIDDLPTQSELIALGAANPERHAPVHLAQRMLAGYKAGVVSIRPLASLLGVDADQLQQELAQPDDGLFDQDLSPSDVDNEATNESLFEGAAA